MKKTRYKYNDIPEQTKLAVYEYYRNNQQNSISIISKKFNLPFAMTSRIIDEKLNESKKKY